MSASSSFKLARPAATIRALLQCLLVLVFLASLVRADCPPPGAIKVKASLSRTRVKRGNVVTITLVMDKITNWGNSTAVYPGLILPHEEHEEGEHEEHEEGEHEEHEEGEHEEEEEHEEHAPAVYRSGTVKPKIWQKALSNRAKLEHEEHQVYFMIPSDYASTARGPGSLGKKAKSAGAARHAFKIDVVVVKSTEEEYLHFEVGVWDGVGGEVCWGIEELEIDLFGPIGVERDH